jgi:hypothetical protein
VIPPPPSHWTTTNVVVRATKSPIVHSLQMRLGFAHEQREKLKTHSHRRRRPVSSECLTRSDRIGRAIRVMRAQAKGFRTTEVNVTLGTAEVQGLNLTLPVGAVSESVNVLGEAPALDTDETRIQATLDTQTVKELPQLNRNLWDVLAVTPGVVGTGTRGAGASPGGGADNFGTQTPALSANGRSYTGNVVFVDGMNVSSPIQNGNLILSPVPDAVQEVSLQPNSWDAENSLGSSILVQITTKSGTNQFHFTGGILYTNQNLQATPDFFSPVRFQRKDLVGTLGGPIIKNKLFFFRRRGNAVLEEPDVRERGGLRHDLNVLGDAAV